MLLPARQDGSDNELLRHDTRVQPPWARNDLNLEIFFHEVKLGLREASLCWLDEQAAGWATLRSVGDSDLIYESKIIHNFSFSLLRLIEATCICERTQQMLFCLSRVALLHWMNVPDGLFTFRGAQGSGRRHVYWCSVAQEIESNISPSAASLFQPWNNCWNVTTHLHFFFFFAAPWKSRRGRCDNKLFVSFFQIRITLRTGAVNIAAPHVSMCKVYQFVFDLFALVNYS